jgi:hypothetical protein
VAVETVIKRRVVLIIVLPALVVDRPNKDAAEADVTRLPVRPVYAVAPAENRAG